MSQLVKAASKDEIAPGCAKKIEVDGSEAALFNCGGAFFAIAETCLHRGGPLSEGSLEGNVVTCPWHGWQYDVTSGACLTNPSVSQKKFNVKTEGNDIFVSA